MFGVKKITQSFNTGSASRGATEEVRRSWQYTTHPEAGKALEAAGARYATKAEVAAFLAPFSKTQQKQTYKEYDGKFSDDEYYMATRDFTLPPLHGALAIRIIVPRGMSCKHDSLGHSQVFDMNHMILRGSDFIMLTKDLAQEIRKQGGDPKNWAPPPPPAPLTPEQVTEKAVAHVQNGLPQAVTVRRISLKQKAS